MSKEEIIERLEEIAKHAVHVLGEKPFFMSLDDGIAIHEAIDILKSAQPEIVMCKDCRWGRKVCGNIECFVDANVPPEYHGYEWFCPNGERRTDEQT